VGTDGDSMSTGNLLFKPKRFLEEHPECLIAFRYLLECPGKRTVLKDLCSRYKISLGVWCSCYNRFGPRYGVGWIETIKGKKYTQTALVQVVPEHATQLNELVNGGEKNGTK